MSESRLSTGPIEDLLDRRAFEAPEGIAPAARRPTSRTAMLAAAFRPSAVVATYQGERFVREQLQSMLQQSAPLHEIVIVDDRSADSTVELAERIAANSVVPVRILRGERRLGIAGNFERGLRAAAGDVVFLADQDDVWRGDKVERMLEEFLRRPDLELLFTDARLIDGDGIGLDRTLFRSLRIGGTEHERVRSGRAFDALLRRNVATGATIALRRSILARALPIPNGWLHDEWLAIVGAASGRIDLLDEPLIDYRQHENNQIGSGPDDLRAIYKKLQSCRRCFNCRLADRTLVLIERLRALEPTVGETRLASLQSKLKHLQRRCRLPRSRLARLPTVVGECFNGGYRRYSSGARSTFGDLFGTIRDCSDHLTGAGR